MKYLIESQIKSYLRSNKSIEQFISKTKISEFDVFKWIAIERNENSYSLVLHEVFDDRQEGIESIYDFSYVQPDDIYGKIITESEDIYDILNSAKKILNADKNKYLTFGFMDQEIK